MRQQSMRAFVTTRFLQIIPGMAQFAVCCAITFYAGGGSANADPSLLTFDEATALAISSADPTVLSHDERATALEHRAIAVAQLPDPEILFGFANWPVESFDYDQEPMTQIKAGVRQRFPRGDSLSILGRRKSSDAQVERAHGLLQLREIARATQHAWLEIFYLTHARDVVRQSRHAVAELVDVVQASFATGLQNNQDLLRAELELSLLDDRALEIERLLLRQHADLARMIGQADGMREVARELPTWPALPARGSVDARIVGHPAVAVQDALIAGRVHDVALANEQYDPGWSLEAGYGARAGGRADFASVMVTVEVPLFTDKRQDQSLAASEQERAAAMQDRDAVLLALRQQVGRALADAERFAERAALYREIVLDRADGAASAALDGYQSQVADFAELIRARLAALDTGLKLKRLDADLGKAHAELIYLLGER